MSEIADDAAIAAWARVRKLEARAERLERAYAAALDDAEDFPGGSSVRELERAGAAMDAAFDRVVEARAAAEAADAAAEDARLAARAGVYDARPAGV